MKQHSYMIAACLAALVLLPCTGCGKTTPDTSESSASVTESAPDDPAAETTAPAAEDSGSDQKSGDKSSDSSDTDSATDNKKQNDSSSSQDDTSSSDSSADDSSSGSEGGAESSQDNTPGTTSRGNSDRRNNTTTPDNGGNQGGQSGRNNSYEVGSNPTIGIGQVTAAPGQKEVPVNICFWNNPGFSTSGFKLSYDPALKPKTNSDKLVYDLGPAANNLTALCSFSENNHLIGFASFGMEDNAESGTVFTVYFDIPDDAEPGSVYGFSIEIRDLLNLENAEISAETIGGEILIEAE